jgi:predicted Rossmann fold flavoprotein
MSPDDRPDSRPDDLPVVVVGAGAAGLMAAIAAASAGRRPVVLLERTPDGGRKILVSGGGRCNVLPEAAAPERFVTDSSPHALRKILLAWPLADQRRFFEEEVGIPLALEAESGKLFPASNRAREVRDGLLALAARRGVERRFGAGGAGGGVVDLGPPHADDPRAAWTVEIAGGGALAAAAVVLATGGLSLPGTGSDGRGLEIARRLGHAIHPTYPALVPLTATPSPHAALAGISLDVTLSAPGAHRGSGPSPARGGFLFTHRGWSGPAVLDLSHLAVRSHLAGGPRQPLLVRWTELDETGWEEALLAARGKVATLLARRLPDRLAATLAAEAGVPPDRTAPQLRRDERRRLLAALAHYPLPWTGDEGYAKAEVTGGGIALSEVDPRTLESHRHPGLFLCGEMLDAFGPIGGHNFSWAWATGRLAGRAAERAGHLG